NDDFARTRQLPGWPEVSAHIARVRRPDSPPVAAPPVTRSTATAPAAAPSPAAPSAVPPPVVRPSAATTTVPPANTPRPPPTEAVRFSSNAFTPAGLAYDAVSGRFLFGDRLARKLFIVSESSNRASDFVRTEPAGFQDIAGIEIDARRGDLWVASTASAAGTGTLHKLQRISGPAPRAVPVAAPPRPGPAPALP